MEERFKLKLGQTVRVKDVDGRIKRDITGKIFDIQRNFIIVKFEKYIESFTRADIFTQKKDGNRQYLVKVGKKEWKQITTEMF